VLYPLAGLHPGREGPFLAALCLASLCSSALCLALGAAAPRSAAGLPLAVLLLLLFLLFGGVMLSEAPSWLVNASYFRSSYQLLVANELSGLMFKFDPVGISKTFDPVAGTEWMRLLHLNDAALAEHVGVLFAWAFCFICVAWALLAQAR